MPIEAAFLLAFVAWQVGATIAAYLSGYVRLLLAHPPRSELAQERFWFASGSLRRLPFHGALYVAIGPAGLHLAPSRVFRPVFTGIACIPWSELRCTQAQVERGGAIPRSSRFEVSRARLTFELLGKPGRAVEAALARAGEAQGG